MNISKFQEGGAMAPETQAAPTQEQDPVAMLIEAATQAVQNQDCQIAMQVCQALVQMAQQPQAPQSEPVYRQGGILHTRI